MSKFNSEKISTDYSNQYSRLSWDENILLLTTQKIDLNINNVKESISPINNSLMYLQLVISKHIESSDLIKSLEYLKDSFLINDVLLEGRFKENLISLKPVIVGGEPRIKLKKDNNSEVCFALFSQNNFYIKIPSKVEYAIKKNIPKKLLLEIHSDEEVAIDLCMLFVSKLASTYIGIIDGTNTSGWKSLKAEYLRDFFSTSSSLYLNILSALKCCKKEGSIIERDDIYVINKKNYYYRIGRNYMSKGIKTYTLTSLNAITLQQKYNNNKIQSIWTNQICRNQICLYSILKLPTTAEINLEADRLITLDFKTKKGKKLTKLNRHPKSYFKNHEERSFVEDSIKIFNYLTENGMMIPRVGNEKSGCRVVDSLTLMPSWIRNLIKINNAKYVEIDYSCLHPNIAVNIYRGNSRSLTHAHIANVLELDVDNVKVEHLSFFNKEGWQMKLSPIYDYYKTHEEFMLQKIINEKEESNFSHKITSRRLFAKEVEIMTKVIKKLNDEGIYVGYVYDALFCEPKYEKIVQQVMNDTILEFGIFTSAKIQSQ